MITLITGGSGSGKSAYAEKYICHASNEKGYKEKYYIATMQVFDDEGQRKIDRHRRLRAGKGFITIEQPRDIQNAVSKLQSESSLKTGRSALLECMSNLVANEMFQEDGAKDDTVPEILEGISEIEKQAKKNHGILEVSGCIESQKAHLMYGLSGLFPSHLVIAADEKSAKELYEDYRFYDKRVYYYPAKDLLFFQADIHGNLLIRQRMQVIRALLEREDEITVVTSIDGCMDYLAPLEKIEKQLIHFRNDSTLDMDKLTAALVHMGYEHVGQVEMPGQFSIRGGIIDIYSLTEENPWRIELWGDEIDSIRSFDAQSQRSLENLDDVTIYPAAEQPMEKNGVSFLDYFKETETLFFLDELNHLEENAKAVQEEFQQSCESKGKGRDQSFR